MDLPTLLAHPDFERVAGLELGVSTSAFQGEGELDLPGRPRTHWFDAQRGGGVEPIGAGVGLWRRFDEAAERCGALGLGVFRLTLEWSRLRPDGPRLSRRAVEGYAARLGSLRARGIEPVVTLHHFTHPRWLGLDFWLHAEAPARFAAHASEVIEALDTALARRGGAPVTRVLTINEPNMLALASYLAGIFPHGAPALAEGSVLGPVRAWRALDAMLAGHCLAYAAIHRGRARRGAPAEVSLNLNLLDLHGLGAGLFDLLRAPFAGVSARGLEDWLAARRSRWHTRLFAHEAQSPRARLARTLDAAAARLLPLGALTRTRDALASLDRAPLDHLGIDLYDPYTAHQLQDPALVEALAAMDLPAVIAAASRGLRLAEPWAWRPAPAALVRMTAALLDDLPSLPVDLVECGMCLERPVGQALANRREDGLTRPGFLRTMLRAALAARVEGLPLRSFLYWTLVDNYELGRWSPRFGLWSLGEGEGAPWGPRDAAGDDAAAVLAGVARAIRARPIDRAALANALSDEG